MNEQEKREKVIKWLEICIKGCDDSCPYKKECESKGGFIEPMRDTLALLKAQEPVEPKTESSGSGVTWWYVCGACLTAINPNDKFCHECGQAVKWE